jgi:hypothetical protein
MVVPDGASTRIGTIWYQMKLVPEEAESWYQMKLVPEEVERWYQMKHRDGTEDGDGTRRGAKMVLDEARAGTGRGAKLVPDGELVLDEVQSWYRKEVQKRWYQKRCSWYRKRCRAWYQMNAKVVPDHCKVPD